MMFFSGKILLFLRSCCFSMAEMYVFIAKWHFEESFADYFDGG